MTAKGTIYVGGIFGYDKIEAREVNHCLNAHAQYIDAVEVTFIPKGHRRRRMLECGWKPRIVILEGWNHPNPNPIYTPVNGNPNLFMTPISGSPEIDARFNSFLDTYLQKNNCVVVADYRGYRPRTKEELIFSKSLRNRRLCEIINSVLCAKSKRQ